jgi:HAE1 family hydrophobic/amphiphilic exporter-1
LFARILEWPLTQLTRFYEWTLAWVLRHRAVMVVIFLAMLAGTYEMFNRVPKGFIPDVDNDQIYVNTEMAQGTGFDQMKQYQLNVARVVRQDPDIDTFLSTVGGSMYGSSSNTGRMYVGLKPRKERKASAQEIVNRLRPRLAAIPGVRAFPSLPPAIRIGGRMSKSNYEVTLQAADTAELYREAAALEKEVAKLPSLVDVSSDIQMRSPRVRIDIDRDKAATYNLSAQAIEEAIYNGYGPSWASTIYAPNAQYRVLLELERKYQDFADMLSRLYMKAPSGRLVPLDEVTKRTEDVGPQSINHSGQLTSVTISFGLKPGVALGDAVEELQELIREKLPQNITASFSGSAKVFQDSMQNLGLLLLISVLVVYIVLGVLYESFIHPITILSGLPSAAFGALFTLILFDIELNLYGFVGLILLIGLVKKNAIMQIDFAIDSQRRHGTGPAEAIFQGCLVRFRPIMMTTAAALLGAVPIAIGYGAGGETRKSLGLVVIGGLIFSQAITLYLTPVVYIYLDRFVAMFSRTKRPAAALGDPQPVAK